MLDERIIEVARAQLAGASARFAAEPARYLALLETIRGPRDVAFEVAPSGPNLWTATICTADFLGALSLIVGLLTAHRLSIVNADILTLTLPRRPPERSARRPGNRRFGAAIPPTIPSHLLLDGFEVRSLDEPAPDLWTSLRADLAALLDPERREDARDEITSRVSEAFREMGPAETKLLPMSIEVSDEPGAPVTRLSVRSADTPGFLFAFASALSALAVDVHQAEIRTVDDAARDTFWVSDVHGQPIRDERRLHELRVATSLIKQFTYLLPGSPDPGQALRQFDALIAQMLSRPEWTRELADLESPAVLETLANLMGVSRFLWEDFLRLQHENLFPLLLDVPSLDQARSKAMLRAELRADLSRADTTEARVEVLNVFKDREMFRIDLRHLTGRSGFEQFSRELTALAEVAVEAAGELSQEALRVRFGEPRLAEGRECPWCTCALGKFGGEELGFGSDLELLFVYADDGATDGPIPIGNAEYFNLLVRTFLQTLRARQEGIFEIDLRLRPYGSGGALARPFDGFADYYRSSGAAEQFERLALVRLRPVAGDPELGRRIRQARDAFVYSGHPLDLPNLLHLRHRQATELVTRGTLNAKYSRGGLVDLEYFVQAWQITAGAADATVRVTNTLEAIQRLEEAGYFSADLTAELRLGYDFLRRLIDALRVVRGHAKDLTIPPDASREFSYLARRLRFATPAALREAIASRMAFAGSLWERAAPG